MFVNKINGVQKFSFKGYQHEINSVGKHSYQFYYPHDTQNQSVVFEFYRTEKDNKSPKGYKVVGNPIKTAQLKENSVSVSFDDITSISPNEAIAYRVLVNGKPVADTGLYTGDRGKNDGYNLINRSGTTPMVQGQSILAMPDIQHPGAYFCDFNSEKTGAIECDINKQRLSEQTVRTFSNKGGGNIAGYIYDIPFFKQYNIKTLFSTPIWGGDNRSSHKYWNKNDMQISDDMGNIDNYETFIRALYKNGMNYVDDFAVTSFGLESLPLQYALRWAGHNPQTQHWMKMSGINDAPLGFGIIPLNKQNLRHRVVNPSVIYNESTKKVEKNPNYNPNKETYFQVYDDSQITDAQRNKLDEAITDYKNNSTGKELSINNSNDTLINYVFEIKPQEYEARLEDYAKSGYEFGLNTPEGTLFIGQFSAFKIGTDAEGAVFWDANKDMVKRNYYISGYDEKLLQAIPDLNQREAERQRILRGNYEMQDYALQIGRYRMETVRDIQLLHTAQALKGAKTYEDIEKLIGKELPEEARLSKEALQNISDGWYELAPKGVEEKDDVTVKSLMKLPLDSLELGDNTSGVLMTSFFSNRAANKEDIGLIRFEAMKKGVIYPQPYNSIYNEIDDLFCGKIKNFADEIIKKVNEISKEKLLDEKGNYTEYGEYVIDLVGKDIAKYAFLKAFAGDKLQTKIMPDNDGKITYNYSELRKITTLKALGINAGSPEEEAEAVKNVIKNGTNSLDRKDVDYVAGAISKRIEGTTTIDFRRSEAMVNQASLGMGIRLDACKDIVDMDAVRNGDMSFDEAWDQVIDFWKKYVQEVKKINPNAYIVAEITDIGQLMSNIYGENFNIYDNDMSIAGGKYKNVKDAITQFFNETGITSEASYSYTFTDLLKVFSAEFEYGSRIKEEDRIGNFKGRMYDLLQNQGLDYIRNLWTFADNHDKPSVLHGMALNMGLFHAHLDVYDEDNSYKPAQNRDARIDVLKELTNSDKFEDLPLEAMLNLDNRDYFRTVSPRAAAMSQLMRDCINDEIRNPELKALLKDALVDLTNGNYLGEGVNFNVKTISTPELSSVEDALAKLMNLAGISLKPNDFNEIVKLAKQKERVEKYTVQGDFDWTYPQEVGEMNRYRLSLIMGNTDDMMKYSPYTVNLTSLLLDAYKTHFNTTSCSPELMSSAKKFVSFYDRAFIEHNKTKLPTMESAAAAMKKNAYAARNLETVVEMIIKQAEFKSGKKFSQVQHDDILVKLFKSSTEPAVQKAVMYGAFLAGLPGIPSLFFRDVLGGLGYDEKAKNVYLQSRNTVKWSELEEGPLKEYRKQILDKFGEVMEIRGLDGAQAINNGTPYILSTSNPDVPAYMFQDGNGNVAISVLNATDIQTANRAEYTSNGNKHVPVQKELELDEIVLPAGLALTVGMIFKNISGKDSSEYVVELKDGIYRLKRKADKLLSKIKMNNDTAKNGVMILKKVGKTAFRGKNLNPQYNIISNPYAKNNKIELGQNLSILSK